MGVLGPDSLGVALDLDDGLPFGLVREPQPQVFVLRFVWLLRVVHPLDLAVQFSEQVTVVGSPTVTIIAKADGTTKTAVYQQGSGTSELIFRYTVEAGLYGAEADKFFSPNYTSTSISLPAGASIRDGDSNNASLTLPPRMTRTYYFNQMPTTKTPPPARVRGGAIFEMYVEFSEPVEVTGNPQALWEFRTAPGTENAFDGWMDYVSGSGTDTLLFRYTMSAADAAPLDKGYQQSSSALWFFEHNGVRSAIRSTATGLDVHFRLQHPWNGPVPIRAVTEGQTHYIPRSMGCCTSWPPVPATSYVEVQMSTPSPYITLTHETPMRWRVQCDPSDTACVTVPFSTWQYATLVVEEDADSQDTWTKISFDWTHGTDTQYKIWWGVWTGDLVILDITDPPLAARLPRPDPPNLARNPIQWNAAGGLHPLPTRLSEISDNEPTAASGSVDLSNIAASVSEHLRRYSRGYYLTTQVFQPDEQPHLFRRGTHGMHEVVAGEAMQPIRSLQAVFSSWSRSGTSTSARRRASTRSSCWATCSSRGPRTAWSRRSRSACPSPAAPIPSASGSPSRAASTPTGRSSRPRSRTARSALSPRASLG